ncbi:type III-B CRISPR module RAMP protein Cmr1 [Clostridium sp. MT-14]|uniref:type III-B CRISPR module RAMP protein Cmr1 n=1 Tax=Clostridium sp. MT-14 TaxID=3348360 RepID=UPI0035F2B77D
MDKEALITANLESLTPIWTGNAFGKTTKIKASSILGSIRWWYEIICRSLGKRVCDNESSKKCELKEREFLKDLSENMDEDKALDDQKICPVCKLFGCNGWAGKIKLIVDDRRGENTADEVQKIQIETRKESTKKRSLEGKMFKKGGTLKLSIYPVKELKTEEIELLNLTIRIISDYAALGSRTSQGNGIIKIIPENPDRQYNIKVKKESPKNSKRENWKIPALENFFFLKIHLKFEEDISSIIKGNYFWVGDTDEKNKKDKDKTDKDNSNLKKWETNWTRYGFIPIGFHIRDVIRRVVEDKRLRHELFGKYEGSKIFVSHGYKIDKKTVEVRIWGYYGSNEIKKLVSEIKSKLKDGKSLKDNLFIDNYNKNLNVNIYSSLYGQELLEKYLKKV